MGELARGYNAKHATGSKAFTENIRRVVGRRAGGSQFKYFNQYGNATQNDIDVLILDEAHRLRETSASRFTPKAMRTDLPQVDELIKAAKTTVFFIDDYQTVRPNEIGSTQPSSRPPIATAPMSPRSSSRPSSACPARRPSSPGSTAAWADRGGQPDLGPDKRNVRLPHRRLGRAARRPNPLKGR